MMFIRLSCCVLSWSHPPQPGRLQRVDMFGSLAACVEDAQETPQQARKTLSQAVRGQPLLGVRGWFFLSVYKG
jgi:hypothetical protein